MPARYALYYTPSFSSPLARFGAAALGYDVFEGVDVTPLKLDGIDAKALKAATAEPRRYGFHATIVAPFHLTTESGEDDLIDAIGRMSASMHPIELGMLTIQTIGEFVALVPQATPNALLDLQAAALKACAPFRLPLSAADRERRMKAALTPRQVELLDRWGYPYVLDEFRYHMTLSGSMPKARRDDLAAALDRVYRARAAQPVTIDALSVLRQDDAAACFRVLKRCRLGG